MEDYHSMNRKEIKDILAYFRMVINPEDEEALKDQSTIQKEASAIPHLERFLN